MEIFEQVGGYEMLKKVNKIFYDKIYAHPWIGQYFKSINQEHIENQQTDFMAQAFGGPEKYAGKFVPDAHVHMMITEELFQVREALLDEAFLEAGANALLIEKWKTIDNAFKRKVVKKSIAECKLRYNTDVIQDFPNPNPLKKAA